MSQHPKHKNKKDKKKERLERMKRIQRIMAAVRLHEEGRKQLTTSGGGVGQGPVRRVDKPEGEEWKNRIGTLRSRLDTSRTTTKAVWRGLTR